MKTNNFLWATLATAILTLTGCSSDDNELTVPQPQDKTALLELRLIGNGINTKATGDDLPTQAEENTVKHFTVAIFNSDNTVNTLHTVTENTASATTISCTPATDCTGIVVANAPSDSYFTGVLSKDDFLKKTIALADAQTKDCLPMSGNIKDKNGNATFTLSAGDNDGITAQLSRLVARISISSIKTEFDPKGQYSAATYELKNIFVRNAIKEVVPGTGEYSTTKMGIPAYLSGNYDSSNGTADYLANAISPATDVKTEHQANYWFYVLPNDLRLWQIDDLIALHDRIMFIQETMVCRYDKVPDVRIVGQAADFLVQFFHSLLAGRKHFVFRAGLIAAGIDLVVVNIHQRLA